MADLILTFLWFVFIEISLVGTGHCVLYLITFGRVKMFHSKDKRNRDYFVGFIVGTMFWIGIASLVKMFGSR
jgi:hypothetical protein